MQTMASVSEGKESIKFKSSINHTIGIWVSVGWQKYKLKTNPGQACFSVISPQHATISHYHPTAKCKYTAMQQE